MATDADFDDTTAAAFGHAFVRWLVDEDPAGVTRAVPDIATDSLDDAKAARLGRTLIDLLQRFEVA